MSTKLAIRPRTTRVRRTNAQMEGFRRAIEGALSEFHPMTVRQVFYQLVVRDVIPKTEAMYKSVCSELVAMRQSGRVPWDWIVDNTRWQRKPTSYSSAEEALRQVARSYRKALWDRMDTYVEIWSESESAAGVLVEATEEWDVPLMAAHGYSSHAFMHSTAKHIERIDKPTFIYYFGDHDPSGKDIARNVEAGLRRYAPDSEIHFKVVAVTAKQMVEWDLPSKPPKKTDPRSKGFRGATTEIEAIHPKKLVDLARECILLHVDSGELAVLQVAEQSERALLESMVRMFAGASS